MRQNTKIFKPNPNKTSRHIIRSYSIRDIIGDRRFNHQFSPANPHRTEGIKKVKRMKVDDAEADDLPNNRGRNSSSGQCEVAEDPRRCCGDFAAKTSEYAFFKKIKQTTSSNMHVQPKYHDNQVNNIQQSDHSTREEIPNVQKESIKYARSSLPVEKERDDDHYSFLSPPFCGSKNSDVNNVHEADGINVLKVTPREVSSKTKTSGNKGVFSVKREKLRCRVADISLNEYDVNEVSSKGIDLVSALISRILPEDQEKNSEDETNSKYKPPCVSKSLIKGHEANKRKSTESCNISYLEDDFSSERRHLEWNPNGLESFFTPKSRFQYHSEACKRKWSESRHISYWDDDFSRSSERLKVTDMDDLLEWNPNHSESSNSSAYKRKWMEWFEWNPRGSKSSIWYTSEDSFRVEKLGIDRYGSGNLDFDNDPTVLEKPLPLLLGWEEKSEKDEFQTEMNTFSRSQEDDEHQVDMMRVERRDHFVIPYTPKHVMGGEDNHTWWLNEKQESFRFCLQSESPSPAKDLNEKENNLMEGFDGKDFDHIGYPLLLLGGE